MEQDLRDFNSPQYMRDKVQQLKAQLKAEREKYDKVVDVEYGVRCDLEALQSKYDKLVEGLKGLRLYNKTSGHNEFVPVVYYMDIEHLLSTHTDHSVGVNKTIKTD